VTPPAAEVLGLFARDECNGFGYWTPSYERTGVGMAPGAALFNHACAPNAVKVQAPGFRVEVRALRALSSGEEARFSYVPLTDDVAARREVLARHFGFGCACERCVVEAEAGGALLLPAAAHDCGGALYPAKSHGLLRGDVLRCSICRKEQSLKSAAGAAAAAKGGGCAGGGGGGKRGGSAEAKALKVAARAAEQEAAAQRAAAQAAAEAAGGDDDSAYDEDDHSYLQEVEADAQAQPLAPQPEPAPAAVEIMAAPSGARSVRSVRSAAPPSVAAPSGSRSISRASAAPPPAPAAEQEAAPAPAVAAPIATQTDAPPSPKPRFGCFGGRGARKSAAPAAPAPPSPAEVAPSSVGDDSSSSYLYDDASALDYDAAFATEEARGHGGEAAAEPPQAQVAPQREGLLGGGSDDESGVGAAPALRSSGARA
jgi:hypothetical protein